MRKLLGFSLTFGAVLAWGGLARAQTVTLGPTVDRYVNGVRVDPRPANLNPLGISYDDCKNDVYLEFSVQQTGITTNNQVQLWGGQQSCADKTARTSGTRQCWKIADGIGLGPVVTVRVPVRAIIADDQTSSGVVSPSADVCTKNRSSGEITYHVNFLPMNGDNVEGSGFDYQIKAKLVGPAAPTNIGAGVGNTLLIATWTPQADTTVQGYRVYCDPPPRKEDEFPRGKTTTDAGTSQTTTTICPEAGTGDADTDGATSSTDAGCVVSQGPAQNGGSSGSGECSSSVLVPAAGTSTTTSSEGGTIVTGPPTDVPAMYLCSSTTGANGAGANITGLRNGTSYAIAVAAVDTYGNSGPLSSPVACATPQLTDDFWGAYRRAGGGAGGGFCALEAVGLPAGTAASWMSVVALGAAWIRRRTARRDR
jgi:hypothetical protein